MKEFEPDKPITPLWHTIFDAVTSGIIVLDDQGKYEYLNDAACRMLGAKREDILDRTPADPLWKVFQEDGSPFPIHQLPSVLAMQSRQSIHHVLMGIQSISGQNYRWISADANPIFSDDQTLQKIVVTLTDITERKRAEDNLRADRNFISRVLNRIGALVMIFDREGNVVHFNRRCEMLSGYHEQEIKSNGDYWLRMIRPEDRKSIKELFRQLLSGVSYLNHENVWVTKSGEHRLISWWNTTLLGEDGQLNYIISSGMDITKQRKIEQQLIEAESKYRSLVEESLIGVYLFQDDKLVYVNPRLSEMAGYKQEEMIGKCFLQFVHREDRPLVSQMVDKRLNDKVQTAHYQFRGLRKDQQIIHVEALGSRTVYNGKSAIIGTIMDVTDKKKTEELLRRSDKLSAVGQLAAGVAHEIRNPLTTLKGFLQWLGPQIENQHYIKVMHDELERINFIVSEFLVLAKPQAVAYEPRHIPALLENIISLTGTQAILRNIEIKLDLEPLPPISCEENQLKQVFVNLLKNAMEAMPNGGTITVKGRMLNKGKISIQIIDEGEGIPQELIPRIGEPFFTTKEAGTGLGLMVSHKIIQNHQGEMYIESELNKGTAITVILPAEQR